MISAYSIVLALVAVLICALVRTSVVRLRRSEEDHRKERCRRLSSHESTHFLDAESYDTVCDICFGEYENGDVAVCSCGKRFHRECAELTEECPYCGSPLGTMKFREIERPACPACGRPLKGNICECGTVCPDKDMTFVCECGERIAASDCRCPKCGSEYGFTYGPPGKPI